jgi:hypothetical protein
MNNHGKTPEELRKSFNEHDENYDNLATDDEKKRLVKSGRHIYRPHRAIWLNRQRGVPIRVAELWVAQFSDEVEATP